MDNFQHGHKQYIILKLVHFMGKFKIITSLLVEIGNQEKQDSANTKKTRLRARQWAISAYRLLQRELSFEVSNLVGVWYKYNKQVLDLPDQFFQRIQINGILMELAKPADAAIGI